MFLSKINKFVYFLFESYENDIMDKQQDIAELYSRLEVESDKIDNIQYNPYYIIATYLPKITPESARKETGGKIGTNQDINMNLVSKDGVTVERAAEDIFDSYLKDMGNIDEQDVRNTIIDILKVGKKSFVSQLLNKDEIKYIKQQIEEEYAELENLYKNVRKIKRT